MGCVQTKLRILNRDAVSASEERSIEHRMEFLTPEPATLPPDHFTALPPELHFAILGYLEARDLRAVRGMSNYWNGLCRAQLRKRTNQSLSFENWKHLAEFNRTFAKYTPLAELASAAFTFKLPVFASAAAAVHLITFVQRFASCVTTLRLYLSEDCDRGHKWFKSRVKKTVLGHVTLLLSKVKGHVEVLEVSYYAGLCHAVIGQDLYPRLRVLRIGNGRLSGDAEVTERRKSLEEGAILSLSSKVPAIQRFEVTSYNGSNAGDPSFLANVLRNLSRVNPSVEVKLDMSLVTWSGEDMLLIENLRTVTVKVTELDVTVYETEALEKVLGWIGDQGDWLKKLTFTLHDRDTSFRGKFSRLRALEELHYVQTTRPSLLKFDSPAQFPNLRCVSTVYTGSDFTVPLSTVMDLTLIHTPLSHWAPWLPPFPNLETLSLPVYFVDMAAICKLKNLVRLKFSLDDRCSTVSKKAVTFWDEVTRGARKVTLEEIRALPEPSGNEARPSTEPRLTDLTHLKQITVTLEKDEEFATVKLNTFLFLSKTGQLQRLQKLSIELEDADSTEVPEVYLAELRKYNNSVVVISSEY